MPADKNTAIHAALTLRAEIVIIGELFLSVQSFRSNRGLQVA
jgi:hypothetical protein